MYNNVPNHAKFLAQTILLAHFFFGNSSVQASFRAPQLILKDQSHHQLIKVREKLFMDWPQRLYN